MSLIVTPGQLNRRAELYHQLGSMITAGMPLIKALQMVGTRRSIIGSREIFHQLVHNLQSGKTFAQSMAETHGWMPEFDKALLSVGEQSGRLDVSFKSLATYYQIRSKIIHETIFGMLLTIATLHVLMLIAPIHLWTDMVQGIMRGDYSACIPYIINKIEIFGATYGAVFLLIFACQARHGFTWRSIIESIVRVIPVLGKAQKYLCLSRLAASLEALNSAGVNIVNGWQIAAKASGSAYLSRHVPDWAEELGRGATPAELVMQDGYFPAVFVNLYETGEQSGKLDESLQRLQEYYQEEGFRALRLFCRILNGLIYGAVVLGVGYYIINFYSGYFEQIRQISQ
jgi:type II secretory pathway component PulF